MGEEYRCSKSEMTIDDFDWLIDLTRKNVSADRIIEDVAALQKYGKTRGEIVKNMTGHIDACKRCSLEYAGELTFITALSNMPAEKFPD